MTPEQFLQNAIVELGAGRLAEAQKHCQRCLTLAPNNPDALDLLGVLASRANQPAAGLELIKRAIKINPRVAEYHVNLGTLLEQLGRRDEAIAAYRHAIALQSDLAEAHNNLGNALAAKGQFELAVASYREALRQRPKFADAFFNLGNSMYELGQYEEAVTAYQHSLEIEPWPPAYSNLADTLRELGRKTEAIDAYQKALAIWPGESPIHKNLGDVYHSQGQIDIAIECYQRAMEFNPANAVAMSNLGNAYKDRGQIPEAIDCYQRSIAIDPQYEVADANRVYALTMHSKYDGPALLRELRIWEDRHAGRGQSAQRPHENERSSDRRLRIGYVSADFRNHVIGRNLLPLFRDRDRKQFEVFCYFNARRSDAMTEKFRAMTDGWRDIVKLNDRQAADLIRADRIDILIDLSLHAAGNRLLIFAQKPAPVQVTFAGYPGGTGLSAIDWRLSDPYLDPPGSDGDYVEKTYRLPHSFWCYDPQAMQWDRDGEAPPEVAELPALQNGYITFGCLNTFAKINQGVLDLWARVLAGIENSHLLVMAPPGFCRERVMEALAKRGVTAERAEFTTYHPRRAYLNQFNRIDLALDTFPYNGHTASLDAMWMGVPVISRVGATVVGRAGWSQLSNLGLTEFAAHSDGEFVKIAAEWAGNLPRLTDLRRTLRQRMLNSPLTDGNLFAKSIEAAYRAIWSEYCTQPEKATSLFTTREWTYTRSKPLIRTICARPADRRLPVFSCTPPHQAAARRAGAAASPLEFPPAAANRWRTAPRSARIPPACVR